MYGVEIILKIIKNTIWNYKVYTLIIELLVFINSNA